MPTSSLFADLSGCCAVVTGSSSGIGRAIALELARGGADVVVHYRQSAEAAEETAAHIRTLGQRADLLAADLADHDAYPSLVQQAWDCFGKVDVWVNNAGVDLLTGDALHWPVTRKLQSLLDVDVFGTVVLSKLAGGRMWDDNGDGAGGVILNIGWDQAACGMEGDSGELFAASKNAVMGFTRSLSLSLAPRVRVNCIAPGWIRTAWGETASERWQQRVLQETPLERWGTPEDVARTARFLASREASFITGQVINVNGGSVR